MPSPETAFCRFRISKAATIPIFPRPSPWTLGLKGLVALMEEHCGRLRAQGKNPALAVDKLRPFTQRIRRSLSVADKQDFCTQHRARWTVVRHRIPQSVAVQIEAAQTEGKLRILHGKMRTVQADGARLKVTIDPGSGQPALRRRCRIAGELHGATRKPDGCAPDAFPQSLSQRAHSTGRGSTWASK